MIFKAMKLDEIIQGVGGGRKEEGPRTEPRGIKLCPLMLPLLKMLFKIPRHTEKPSH
jgi:hypothetical protein